MSIWDLLLGICFFISVIGSWDAAKSSGSGVPAYALAVITGAIIGGACAWSMRRVGETVETRISIMRSESKRLWYLRALYLSSVFWIALSGGLGRTVSGILMRVVFNR